MGIKIWWPMLFVGSIVLACVLIFPSDLRLADLFGKAGKYDEAIQKYQEILKQRPSRTSARIQLSRLYMLNEQPEKAVEEIEEVGIDSIDDEFFLMQIADVYSQLGDKEKTIQARKKIVDLAPHNLAYRRKLADAYDWNGEMEKAYVLYEALLTHNPGDADLLNKVVHINLRQKRFRESAPYLQKLVEIQPNDTRSRILLADVFIETDRKWAAAWEFERVLKIEPRNEPVRRRLAELYLWLGDFENGLAQYEYLVVRDPTNERYFDRYTELAYNLDPEKAIHYYRLRLEAAPRNYKLRERLAGLYLHVGNTENAVQQMSVLIAGNSESPKYYKQLGYLYQDMREPHLANRIFETMFEKELEDEDVINELIAYYQNEKEYDKLLSLYPELFDRDRVGEEWIEEFADLLVRTRNYDEAIRQYSKLLKLQPKNSEYRMQLADLHRLGGENSPAVRLLWDGVKEYNIKDEDYLLYTAQFLTEQHLLSQSVECYEKLADIAPGNIHYKELLVSHYVKNNDFVNAIRLYNDILSRNPDDVDAKFELATLYWLQKDFEGMHEVLDTIDLTLKNGQHFNKKIGEFYFEHRFFNEAIEYLSKELQSTPNDSSSQRMLGLAYAWNNHPKEAKRILTQYNALYPNDYYTHFEVGELLILERKIKKASDEFQISLELIASQPENKETRSVRARIYAHQKERDKAIDEFDNLIASYPDDITLYLDYAESMLNLKDFKRSDQLLNQALEMAPENYRALRLQSRSDFEQGKYASAARVLRGLQQRFPDDIGLQIDLADGELAAGDWYRTTETLKSILRKYPKSLPAQDRLTYVRRQQSQAVSTDYQTEMQSDNFFRRVYNVVVTKAKSSLLHFKLLFGEEKYSTKDSSLPEEKYQNVAAQLSSSFNKNLKASAGAKVRQNGDNWYLTIRGRTQWNFNLSNSLSLSTDLNELWNDPFTAAFQKGRLNRFQSDLNLYLLNKIFVWNRFSYEQHKFKNGRFGNVLRSYLQIGHRWHFKPELSAYYQLYHLKYSFAPQADQNLVSVLEKELVHYIGGNLEHQLAGKLYYHLGGSIGFSGVQDYVNLYGTFGLEYTLLNRLRFRSMFEYGNQNQIAGNDKNTSLWFDFSFFY